MSELSSITSASRFINDQEAAQEAAHDAEVRSQRDIQSQVDASGGTIDVGVGDHAARLEAALQEYRVGGNSVDSITEGEIQLARAYRIVRSVTGERRVRNFSPEDRIRFRARLLERQERDNERNRRRQEEGRGVYRYGGGSIDGIGMPNFTPVESNHDWEPTAPHPSEYYHSNAKLTRTQKKLVSLFKRKKQDLIGMTVFIVANENGGYLTSRARVMILKLPRDPLKNPFTTQFPEGRIFNAHLWQIETAEAFIKQPDSVAQIVTKVVKNANILANDEYKNMLARVNERKGNATHLEENLQKTKIQLSKYQAKLKTFKQNSIKEYHIAGEIKNIRKHAKIKSAYVTTQGNIIVKTKMLYKIDAKTNKVDRKVEIGEFIFKFNLDMSRDLGRRVRGFNTTYYVCNCCVGSGEHGYSHEGLNHALSFGHPVLGEFLCAGDHEIEVKDMLHKLNLYLLVDFLVLLFSIYPEDNEGSPFISYEQWDKYHKPLEDNFTTPSEFMEEKIKWP